MTKHKPKSIIDFINCVFGEKTPWEGLTETDRKAFSVFMMNRWISMHPDYVGVINYLQQFNLTEMAPKEAYRLYCDLLPKQKFWSKYIKAKKTKGDKFSPKLIELLVSNEGWSIAEAEENLSMILKHPAVGNESLMGYLQAYGISEKDAKKSYGIKL